MNRITLIGRLGSDPTLRKMQSGESVANISIATDESYKDRDGNKVKQTEWHRVVVYGKLAEICGDYLKKGRLVLFEGKNKTREWTDKDKIKRFTTEVICNDMQMLDAPKESSHEIEAPLPAEATAPAEDCPF